MTVLLCAACLGFGYWLGGASPVRIAAFVAWIKARPWKKEKPNV